MRLACGLVFLFVAAGCLWGTFASAFTAHTIGNEDVVHRVGHWALGTEKQATNSAVIWGVGALIFGAIGAVVLMTGRGAQSGPVEQTNRPEVSGTQSSGRRSNGGAEERLAKIKELHRSGLISDQEFEAKRRQILEEI